jgi:hypothetical protein
VLQYVASLIRDFLNPVHKNISNSKPHPENLETIAEGKGSSSPDASKFQKEEPSLIWWFDTRPSLMHTSQNVLAGRTTHSLDHSLIADFSLDIFLRSFTLLKAEILIVHTIASSFKTGQEVSCPFNSCQLARSDLARFPSGSCIS